MPWRLNLPRLAACRISGLLLATLLPFAAATWSTARQPRDAGKVKPPAAQDAPRLAPFTPDKFLEGIFGQADDDQALAGVDVSRDEESRMGSAAAEAYLADLRRQKLSVATRGKEVDYLRDLVETLRPFMQNRDRYPKIDVHLVDSRQCDARSFPGGTLVFFRGLFDVAESEAALVGVVGHELSHLDHGHQLREVKRVKLAEQAFTGGPRGLTSGEAFSPQRLMSIGRTLSAGWARPFRPEDEEQADRDGATWAYQAGYDPRELATLFLRMHKRDNDRADPQRVGEIRRGGNRRDKVLRDRQAGQNQAGQNAVSAIAFFRTHPFHADRAKAIDALSADLVKQRPEKRLYVGKENLHQRTARVRREFPE